MKLRSLGDVFEEVFWSDKTPAWAIDTHNGNVAHICDDCGAWMTVVRPGKVQCEICDLALP